MVLSERVIISVLRVQIPRSTSNAMLSGCQDLRSRVGISSCCVCGSMTSYIVILPRPAKGLSSAQSVRKVNDSASTASATPADPHTVRSNGQTSLARKSPGRPDRGTQTPLPILRNRPRSSYVVLCKALRESLNSCDDVLTTRCS